jgi:hypothetical protein
VAGRTKTRRTRRLRQPTDPHLAAIYQEEYSTFEALRTALVQNGIVEHGLNPYEVIQRAIDDTTTDYLLIRQRIEKDTNGNIKLFTEHPLYSDMQQTREAMVRYSTFAAQYDIQKRQLKITEARIGLLAHALRHLLQGYGLNPDQINEVPQKLIEVIRQQESPTNPALPRPTLEKATAIAEIMHRDADIVIEDLTDA